MRGSILVQMITDLLIDLNLKLLKYWIDSNLIKRISKRKDKMVQAIYDRDEPQITTDWYDKDAFELAMKRA